MAEERQPPNVVEGATTGDVDEDVPATAAKSAEDRKAAAALSALDDAPRGDNDDANNVDQEAARKAMNKLGGTAKQDESKKDLKKVKVDAADVALLVDQLELTKAKATELLKQHDGNPVKAMRAFITPNF